MTSRRLSTRPPLHLPLTACLVLSAAACAFGNRHPNLHYPPAGEPQGPVAVVTLSPEAPAVAVRVTDMRQGSRTTVGEVRNGFGMHTADVEIQQDPVVWVKEALERELTVQGFRVVQAEGESGLLSSELVALHCDAYLSYAAEVSLRVEFKTGQTAIPPVVYVGHGSAGVNMAASEDSYSESLALALQDAARQVAAQLRWALTQPGRPPPVARPSS